MALRTAALPSFGMGPGAAAPASANEQWARLTNDPLLAIKQQEQEALCQQDLMGQRALQARQLQEQQVLQAQQ